MKERSFSTLIAGAALALFTTSSALADDLTPPTQATAGWDRGDTGSTWQEWEFLTADSPALPDAGVNPYATLWPPFALVGGHDYFDEPGREGIWSLSGVMAFHVPNTPWLYEKDVWLQLTWRDTAGDAVISEPILGMRDNVGTEFSLTEKSRVSLPDGWTYSVYEGTISPNPPYEVVGIHGDIDVDQVVIDTFCPEPQTYALLAGLSLLGFGVWRRIRS